MGGLKPSVIYTPDPVAPQLVDTGTRRNIRLTASEAKVLVKFDGSQTAKELALWAANEGLAIGPLQVQVVLERLLHAGFVLTAPHVPPQDLRDVAFGPTDDPLKPEHIVPSMRSDLKIVATVGARSTYQVSDPAAHRAFTLFDFEVSIARMLDGRRTAAQVVEAAATIGITLTVDSLRRFLLQLKAFKFLSAEPANIKRGAQTTWPMRAEWTEDLRQLFQNVLRLLRTGKLKESREYLLAMLEIDPMNKEAQEFKARVDELMREPIVELTFADLHREPASSTGALLDSNLRVAVALSAEDLLPVAIPPPAVSAPLLPVGVRPTAPEMPAVQPAPVAIDLLLPEIADATPMEPEAAALEPLASEPVVQEPVPVFEDQEPPQPYDEPVVGVPVPPVLMPVQTTAPEPAPQPSAPNPAESIISDTVFAPPPSVPKPISAISADELGAALPKMPSMPSIVVDGIEPEVIPASAMAAPIADKPLPAEPQEELAPPPKKKGGARRAMIALLLIGIAVLLAVPTPRTTSLPCELSELELATVTAPRPGVVDQLPVSEGQVVEKGQLLATLAAKETETQLERAKARATALEGQLEALAKSVKPAEVEKAKAALAEKTKELTQATEHKRKVEAKHSPASAVAKAEKDVKAKQTAVDKATAELDKLSHESKLSSNRLVLEGLKKQSAQLEAELEAAKIVAPEAGKVEGLVAAGSTLADHAVVARIVAPGKLGVTAKGSVEAKSGTVKAGGASWPINDLSRADDALKGTLDAKDAKPGPATLELSLGKRSWAFDLIELAKQRLH